MEYPVYRPFPLSHSFPTTTTRSVSRMPNFNGEKKKIIIFFFNHTNVVAVPMSVMPTVRDEAEPTEKEAHTMARDDAEKDAVSRCPKFRVTDDQSVEDQSHAPRKIANETTSTDRPGRKGPPLSWSQRLKIAVDVARGLNYLHFDRAVPHGNLKATNILLDGPDLNARVADYCLHRLMTQAGTMEQILDAGVFGYRAPELAASKKPLPSFKSDVYAFGVILLELLSGRCAGDVISGEDGGVDLTDWVRLKVAEGKGSECIDPALVPEMEMPTAKGMKEVQVIALRCVVPVSERPGIKTIYEDLSSI